MNYRDKVLKYFDFTSSMELSVGNKKKKSINITGKPTKRTIAFFLMFIGFMYLIYALLKISSTSIFSDIESINLIIKTTQIIGLIVPIIVTIMVFIKSKNVFKTEESSPMNINIYQRELPSKLKPAHVRMLLNDGLIDGTSVATTLLDLIDNGYLELSRNQSKQDIFNSNDITLAKTNKDQSNLLEYEIFLIDWFIDKCGDGSKITSRELKNALNFTAKSQYTARYLFEYFQALTIISFPIYKYYKKRPFSNKDKINVALLVIGFVLFTNSFGLSIFIYCFGTILFASPKYILNKEGVEQRDSWLDLKRFLIDFGDIKNKTPEMTVLWDYYLTYSVALGIDGIANQEIESFFGKEIYNGFIENEGNVYISNSPSEKSMIENNIIKERTKYEQVIGLN